MRSSLLEELFTLLGPLATLLGAMATVLVALVAVRGGRLGRVEFKGVDATLELEAARYRKKLSGDGVASSDHLASYTERNFALLREYHAQGLAQSKLSFWISMVFAGLGFIVIVIGGLVVPWVSESGAQGGTTIALAQRGLSVLAGAIIQSVGALFIVQANRARSLMAEFFDKLRADRKLEEALKLASDLPDEQMRSRLQAMLALQFSGLDRDTGKTMDAVLLGVSAASAKSQSGKAGAKAGDQTAAGEPQAQPKAAKGKSREQSEADAAS